MRCKETSVLLVNGSVTRQWLDARYFQIIQLLRGKKASKSRESNAGLVEQYLDADMGLANDIIDRLCRSTWLI